MTPEIHKWVGSVKKKYPLNGLNILEVGSRDINGGIKDIFTDANSYVGTDMIEGAGVDEVVNAHDLKEHFADRIFDLIICLETLEHDNKFWVSIQNMHDLLKKGGFLMISTPTTGFPEHRHPRDYFRYMPDTYREIFFDGFELLELGVIVDKLGNPSIVGFGKKK